MPIIRVEMLEGRPPEVKRDLIARLTAAVAESLGSRPEQVRVLLYELPAEHWGVGGTPIGARRPDDPPTAS